MKDSFKFITESKDNLALLEVLDNIIKNKESKEVKELNKLFNDTMYKIIKAGIKSIDFDKLSETAKNLLVGFISSLKPKEEVNAKEILNKILNSYASKRRGEEVEQKFEEIKASFKECVSEMIKNGIIDFELEKLPPFSSELFDKYTEYKYIATQANGGQQAFNNLNELKASGIEYKEYKLNIKMKEAEKKIGNFNYLNQWWKGKNRKIESFIISTDLGMDIHIDENLLNESFKESIFYIKSSIYGKYRISESVSFLIPNTEYNTTTMPSWIKNLDTGKISILESTELEKKLELSGEILKGIYIAKRETENSDFWNIHKEAKHSYDKCMECSEAPKYEVKWAEGKAHAWFCENHFKSWSKEHKNDINNVKETKNGVATVKFSDNKNPDIKDSILK